MGKREGKPPIASQCGIIWHDDWEIKAYHKDQSLSLIDKVGERKDEKDNILKAAPPRRTVSDGEVERDIQRRGKDTTGNFPARGKVST